jgi:hypothetical protein
LQKGPRKKYWAELHELGGVLKTDLLRVSEEALLPLRVAPFNIRNKETTNIVTIPLKASLRMNELKKFIRCANLERERFLLGMCLQ